MADSFVSFKDMADAIRDDLRLRFREKLPFACVVALTRTAVKCRDEMKEHARKAFDRPTPYALNAFAARPATKQNLASTVYLKPGTGGKMTPASYFLGPEIEGGVRRTKRSEKAFAAAGLINPGAYVTPGSAAALDEYGNQSRGQIVQIMSILRAFGEQGYRANRVKGWSRKTRTGQIFAVRGGSNRRGLKPGVYRRKAGGGVECLMIFVKKTPVYRQRLPFNELVAADAARIFPAELDAALERFA